MNIIICVKAIPGRLMDSELPYVLNPYDLLAVKQTVALKQIGFTGTISCICMAPLAAKEVLVRCLAIGADDAILLNDTSFSGADTYATSAILAQAIAMIPYNLIVCGCKSLDGETGQVAYGLASRLKLRCLDHVKTIQYHAEEIGITFNDRKGIYKAKIKDKAVITFQDYSIHSGVSLFALKQARTKSITIWNAANIEWQEESKNDIMSRTKVTNMVKMKPLDNRKRQEIEGGIVEKTAFLLRCISSGGQFGRI